MEVSLVDRVEQVARELGRARLAAARRVPSPHWSSRWPTRSDWAASLRVRREVGEVQAVARWEGERMVEAVE
ncbi:hypothetical protein AU186_09340 [Mycobacterium sp. GA-1999]|nr:hypothetical protein AU186_09340 [Mycobacterium sp. GA-1999]